MFIKETPHKYPLLYVKKKNGPWLCKKIKSIKEQIIKPVLTALIYFKLIPNKIRI